MGSYLEALSREATINQLVQQTIVMNFNNFTRKFNAFEIKWSEKFYKKYQRWLGRQSLFS